MSGRFVAFNNYQPLGQIVRFGWKPIGRGGTPTGTSPRHGQYMLNGTQPYIAFRHPFAGGAPPPPVSTIPPHLYMLSQLGVFLGREPL